MSNELLASKTIIVEEQPRIRQIAGVATNIFGMTGITARGPVGEHLRSTSFEEWLNVFGGDIVDGDASHAVRGFFQNGGQVLDFVRTVHYTDVTVAASKTSVAGTLQLSTGAGAATQGSVLGTVAEPYDLEPGDTLDISVDGGGTLTATFAAVAALQNSGVETYALSDGQTLTLAIDGGPVQTVTFNTAEFAAIGAATALEVAAVINAESTGLSATAIAGPAVRITSDSRGTGSTVDVTGGTANAALGFPTGTGGTGTGTGNVQFIDAVTVAEAKVVIEAAAAGVTVSNSGGQTLITRDLAGLASSVQVEATSTADDEFGFDNATHAGTDGAAVPTANTPARYDGAYSSDVTIKILDATSGAAAEFNMQVLDGGLIVATFPNLTMDSTSDDYAETIVNDADSGSQLIQFSDLAAVGTALQRRPVNGTFGPLTGGDDGLTGLADIDFIGDAAGPTGLRVLDGSIDLSILAVPDRPTAAVQNAMISYCEDTRGLSVFAVLDPPAGMDKFQIITYVETTASLLNLSELGAMYWPQVKVLNPNTSIFGSDDSIVVPPSGHIAGTYARTDASQPGGVYLQPAGVERGILKGVVGFEDDEVLKEATRDLVFPKRINPLTTQPGNPLYIDGARTLKGNGNFPSVGERRGVIFIEQSVKRGLEFARHSNNSPALRAQVNRTIAAFLLIQFNQGAFRGTTPSNSFTLDTGSGLNPATAIFGGKLSARIGLATNKPAEFIILRFAQDTRDLDEELAAAGV